LEFEQKDKYYRNILFNVLSPAREKALSFLRETKEAKPKL